MFNCQVVKKQKKRAVFSPLISPKPRAKSVQRVHKLEMKKKLFNIAGDEVFHEQGGGHVPGGGECFLLGYST